MNDAEFDRLMARAADPSIVPGIYNYCDRRCDRCRFSERCLSYIESREATRDPAAAPSGGTVASQALDRALELVRIVSERQGIDLTKAPAQPVAHDIEDWERRAHADPLVSLSKQYAMTSWNITRALWPIVMTRGDEAVIDALETIESLCTSVATKPFRAVAGSLERDFDPTEVQSDPNGSAKIARLLVDESRGAWRVLMEVGRATADGVPARLVKMLDELDAMIAARFPRAMEFVRPGFDTEPVPSKEGHDDLALSAVPQGHA